MVVLTDREPFEYRYMSGRLLADLFQHDEATRRRWKVQGGISASIGSLQASRAELDHTNMHALAARAAQLVSDHTSSLTSTAAAAIYIKDQLDLRFGIFAPFMGWEGGEVACYSGEMTNEDNERVFLALFGSASNVVGYRADGGTGYCPSDMMGLYTMLDLVREPDDPEMDFEYLWDDGQRDKLFRVDAAVKYCRGNVSKRIGVHDFLARIFFEVDDFRYDDHFTGRVIVGTPLWIATPRPVLWNAGRPGASRS